jgi:type IX secretion system PorP/SprF family membrane protein
MKTRLRTYCASAFLILNAAFLISQDIHFSQPWMQPLYLNAGNAGLFDGDYRVGGIYRNQWRAVPVPYSTISFMGDARFSGVLSQQSALGAGVIFNHDISGDSRYAINQLYLPVSHIQSFRNDSNLAVSFGFSPGISNIAFRTNRLTFDNQFDGDAYNGALPTGENFPTLSRTYLDLGVGITLQYKFKGTGLVQAGTAYSHVNRPRVSFFKNDAIRLYAKSNSFVSLRYPITQKVSAHGDLLYEKQGPFTETVLSLRASYLLNPADNVNLYAGVSTRLKDAFILLLGMDYKNYRLGFAYDVNTSKFIAATNRRGAFEVGLIYIFRKNPVFTPKKRSCPIYM